MPVRGLFDWRLKMRLFRQTLIWLRSRRRAGLRSWRGDRKRRRKRLDHSRLVQCRRRRAARKERRRMMPLLQGEGVDRNSGDRCNAKRAGDDGQVALRLNLPPAGAAPLRCWRFAASPLRPRGRFSQNVIMIGGSQGFTQFSSPSFVGKPHIVRRRGGSGQSYRSSRTTALY